MRRAEGVRSIICCVQSDRGDHRSGARHRAVAGPTARDGGALRASRTSLRENQDLQAGRYAD